MQIKQLEKTAQYKFIGWVIISFPIETKEEKIQGIIKLLFIEKTSTIKSPIRGEKEVNTEVFSEQVVGVNNVDLEGSTFEQPYGTFQPYVAALGNVFNVEVFKEKNGVVYKIKP